MNECRIIMEESLKNKKRTNFDKKVYKNVIYDNLQSKIIITNLDKHIKEKMNAYFNPFQTKKTIYDYMPLCSNKKSSREIIDNCHTKILNFNEFTTINDFDNFFINAAYNCLISNRINIKRVGQIEYKSYDLSNNENDSIFFDVYKDNEITEQNVSTCIFLIQSNEKIFGNLDTYIIQQSIFKSSSESDEKNKNIVKKEIKMTKELMIIMTGNILYCPQPLYGKGIRSYVIVRLHH